MSFKPKYYFGPSILQRVIIDQSDTIAIGDLVKLRNGNVEVSSAGVASSGVVMGLVDKNGMSVFGQGATLGSATVSGNPNSGSVTVASDNETVDMIAAEVELSPWVVYSGTVTGTMNTTEASNKLGGWVDVDDEDSINETTHTRTVGTGGTLKNWGVDPDDSTRMLVSVVEHETFASPVALT